MAMKVKGIDEQMLFKIGRLNLRNKFKEWFKKLVVALIDCTTTKVRCNLLA